MERLYTVTYMKYGPTNFNPESWQYQAAEYMWNAGVDNIVKDDYLTPPIASRIFWT